MIRHISFTILVVCSFFLAGQAQDPIFSQFYAAPLQLNPALTGNTYQPHFTLNYRNQWPDLNKAYVTYSASFSQFSKALNSGFGLLVLSDDAGNGLYKTNKLSGLYAYRVQLAKDYYLKIGVEGSFVQNRVDWDKLIFYDQIDQIDGPIDPVTGLPNPTEETQPAELNKSYFDVSTGFLIYSKQFFGGFGLKHLNTPDETITGVNDNLNNGLPMRFTMHAGAQLTLIEGNKKRAPTLLSPNIMYIKQGDFGQFNVGTYLSFGFIYGGAWYRHALTNPDAAIFLLGVQKGVLKVGYSYDMTVSGLAGKSGGSHEISITLNFERPEKYDYNDCFQMFR